MLFTEYILFLCNAYRRNWNKNFRLFTRWKMYQLVEKLSKRHLSTVGITSLDVTEGKHQANTFNRTHSWDLTKAADTLSQNSFLGMRSLYERTGLSTRVILLMAHRPHRTLYHAKGKNPEVICANPPITSRAPCGTVSLDALSTAGIKQVCGLNIPALSPKTIDYHLHYNLGRGKSSSVKI